MFVIHDYSLAVAFCVITMLCWGSWANTQKLAGSSWRFELFYWDYVIGIMIFALVSGLTLGSVGDEGRSFIADLAQASSNNLVSAFVGGVIFNLANLLIVAAIAIAGMSVAFPVGIGLALILGVLVNYLGSEQGDGLLLSVGVLLVALAIIVNAIAYRKKMSGNAPVSKKGLLLALAGGILMAFFYRFIASSMDLENFASPAEGKMTPYSAVFIFSFGILCSNSLFNSWLLYHPVSGEPSGYREWFAGTARQHFFGILGGLIWGLGNSFNLIAAGKAGPAISYGLGQGATLVAALWGVFVWKEFHGSSQAVKWLLLAMFTLFLGGIILIVKAG